MKSAMKHTAVTCLVLLILWQLAVSLGQVNTSLFPSPLQVGAAFGELWTGGLAGSLSEASLLGNILVSLARFLMGFTLSAILGISLGLMLGLFPRAFAYVNPLIQLLRPVAPVAWMPFIVLWLGIGDIPAIAIIFIAGFFPVLLSTVKAVGALPAVYWKVAENFEMNRWQRIFKVILPGIFPQIMTSLQLALGTSWIFLVSGEMVGAQSGLGFLIMDAKNSIRPDALLAVILVIGGIGLVLNKLVGMAEHWVKKRWGLGNV
ncbi:ABC transporter permease [Eubacterium barkeri]|uniref:NitT/TauT family transport system permease protein n=1 Tax=Eubacterium barkeri TaxID=1528 RepID=A0A1H3CKU6_EUBBA|nr:ABC transporter permease [Eubacterium barkeri]SDX54069.1 NitT/TauT family transport system permease protein [Eubacterium barkeri]